jgi:hypothetical protein
LFREVSGISWKKKSRILVHHPNSAQDGVGTWTVIFKSIAVGVCFALPGAEGSGKCDFVK